MKLLIVSNGYPPRGQWGTEFYTRELVRGLQLRGHELHVLAPERSGSRPRFELERERVPEADIWYLHNAGDPRKRFADSYQNERVEQAFEKLLDELQPELVHFTYLLWGLSVRLPEIARARGIPSVLTLTDYGLVCHRAQMYDWRLTRCFGPHPPAVCAHCARTPSRFDHPLLERVGRQVLAEGLAMLGGFGRVPVARDLELREAAVRASLASVHTVIAPTEVVAQAFLRFGLAPERLVRLVYALDERALACARPEPPPFPIVFGFLGQFTPHKGLATLLEAVALLRHRLPESVEPWEVRLYGAPSGGRHRLYAPAVLPRERDARLRVMKAFAPEHAPEVLAQLHALVLPSEWDENAPLSVLQARAAGVPILASAVPGVREVVEQGVHGILFPLGDARALADAMREVILGRMRRRPAPAPPHGLDEHLCRIEAIHARARAETQALSRA